VHRRHAFTALGLAFLGLGASLFFLDVWSYDEGGAGAPGSAAATSPDRAAKPLELHSAAISAEGGARIAQSSPPIEAEHAGLRSTRRVEGRVLVPVGAPVDEHVEVVLEYFPRTTDHEAQMRKWAGEWEEGARVGIGVDGRFALAIPADADVARVALDARYLHSDDVPVEDLDSPEFVTLRPRVGAHVTFVLVPPPDARRDPSCLVGRRIRLAHLPRGFPYSGTRPTIELVVAPDLTLEARGVRVHDQYAILRRSTSSDEGEDLAPFLVVESWDPKFSPGVHARVEIPLLEGVSLSGRLRDASDAPIEGGMVIATCQLGASKSMWYEFSDADGRFAFEALHPSLQFLSAQKEGYVSSKLQGSALGDGLQRDGLDLVLMPASDTR
jgi:hypothetical protein